MSERKIITDNFILTCNDDEIKEGDSFYIIGGHPIGDGIRTCYWISKNRACWSEKNQNWISETCDMLYIDPYDSQGWGFVERYNAKKIILKENICQKEK